LARSRHHRRHDSRALALDPGLQSARYRRAVLFLQLQRYAEAESDLNILLTRQPDWSGRLHFKRAQARMHLGRFAEAQTDLNVVRARNPGAWRQIDQATVLLQTLRRGMH
jgi:predicted Zn-dependent protease